MAKGDIEGDIIYRDRATKTLNDVAGASDKTGKKLGGLGKVAGLAGTAVGLMAVKFGKDSVEAFGEAEKAQASLTLAYEKFPKTADVSIESLRSLNSELARKTTFDDDAFASGQAVLAQFDLTGKQIQALSPLMADLAVKTGQDLPGAATLLGKAFNGNTKALKALGIRYKATGDQAKDQAAITALLEAKVGGAAEAMGGTAAGKAEILKNQYGELEETVGGKLIPGLTKLAEVGLKVIDFASRNADVIGPLAIGVGLLAGTVWGINKATAAWIATQKVLALVLPVAEGEVWSLNAALDANPIGAVVLALLALSAGLVLAYKKSETFRNIVHGTMDGARKSIGWVIDRGKDLVGWFTSLPGKIEAMGKGLVNVITWPYRTAFSFIAKAWNSTVGKLSFTVPDWVPKLGGKGWSMPNLPESIPGLAKGGIVPATPGGRIVRVAEAGQDEAIVPLPARRRGGSGGDTYVFNISGVIGDRASLVRWIEQALAEKTQNRGTRLAFES